MQKFDQKMNREWLWRDHKIYIKSVGHNHRKENYCKSNLNLNQSSRLYISITFRNYSIVLVLKDLC